MLSDDVLLNTFRHHLDAFSRFWLMLAQVCRRYVSHPAMNSRMTPCRSAFIASGRTRSSPFFALTRERPYAALTSQAERRRARRTETVRRARVWSTSTERCSRRTKNALKKRCTTTVCAFPSVFLVLADSQAATVPQIAFLEANAQALPPETFPDSAYYNIYTIAFGIRHVTSILDVLREVHRVLKPGGTFACLEFNKVTNPMLAQYVPPPVYLSIGF